VRNSQNNNRRGIGQNEHQFRRISILKEERQEKAAQRNTVSGTATGRVKVEGVEAFPFRDNKGQKVKGRRISEAGGQRIKTRPNKRNE